MLIKHGGEWNRAAGSRVPTVTFDYVRRVDLYVLALHALGDRWAVGFDAGNAEQMLVSAVHVVAGTQPASLVAR